MAQKVFASMFLDVRDYTASVTIRHVKVLAVVLAWQAITMANVACTQSMATVSENYNTLQDRRDKMEMHTFNAYGKTFADEFGTMSRAMETANKELLCQNPLSKDGAWFQVGTSNEWRWQEGNFFD